MGNYLQQYPIGKPPSAQNPDGGNVFRFYDQFGVLHIKLPDGSVRKHIPQDTDFVDFDPQSSPPSHKEGRIYYDQNDRAVTAYTENPNFAHNLGKELVVDAKNNSGVQINNGDAVYLSIPDSGLPTIELAQADAYSTSNAVGIATVDIPNGSVGPVTAQGLVKNIDTSAFTEGAILYLSEDTAGGLTQTSPALKTIIGQCIVSDATNGKILVGNAKISRANNIITVRGLEDLPDPVSSEIQLKDGITYRFVNSVDISTNTLVMGSNTTITGENSFADHIVYQGTGHAIRGRDVTGTIRDLHIEAPNGTGIDWEDTTGNEKTNTLNVYGVTFHNIDIVARIDNLKIFRWERNRIEDTISNGISFEGSQIGDILIFDNIFNQYSGVGIDLGTCVADVIQIDRNQIHVPTGSTGVSGLASSGNIGPNEVRGKIFDCTFLNEGGTNTSGITKADLKWEFVSLNIPNSQVVGSMFIEGNAATTTSITSTGTWFKIAGTTVAGDNERFTMTGDNTLRYDGLQADYLATIWVTLDIENNEGGTTDLEVTVFQNGSKVPNVTVFPDDIGPTSNNIGLSADLVLQTNDTLEVYVRSLNTTDDPRVTNMQVQVR